VDRADITIILSAKKGKVQEVGHDNPKDMFWNLEQAMKRLKKAIRLFIEQVLAIFMELTVAVHLDA
jgi:hypothetical protein